MAAITTLTTTAGPAMVTATSRAARLLALLGATGLLVAMVAVAAGNGWGSRAQANGARTAHSGAPQELIPRGPIPTPRGWSKVTIPSGAATLAYPSVWTSIPGDSGTVSLALRGEGGSYRGYLNVTPREGAEQLAGWAKFRTVRNEGDGDTHVRALASSEHVAFADARGSCVVDDYISRVGSHRYRELACLVKGRHTTSVFVGATLLGEWPQLGPVVERSAAALLER
jgi:hypothetical protein